MKAVALDFQARQMNVREVDPPALREPDQARIRIHEVGVCGTDREIAKFHFNLPPTGDPYLVMGHEALGQVVEVGSAVTTLQPGDWVVPVIRRPCALRCRACSRGRQDLCLTGQYRERGIWGLHGYWTEEAVDPAASLIRIPAELADVAVLLEPLTNVEKVVERALRLYELGDARSALVLGLGPIGMLAALLLQLRGLEVSLYSLEPPDHPRAQWLSGLGIRYLEALSNVQADIIVEATGAPSLMEEAARHLAPLGVYAVMGIADTAVPLRLFDLLFGNRVVFGSVNSSPDAFRQGVEDLGRFDRDTLRRMVSRYPFSAFGETVLGAPAVAPKSVHVVA